MRESSVFQYSRAISQERRLFAFLGTQVILKQLEVGTFSAPWVPCKILHRPRIDSGNNMFHNIRPLQAWIFVAVLLSFDGTVFGQWIDIKNLPEDVLNCDECRRRLGLPPITDPNRKPSSHEPASTALPTTNTTFKEIILSSRVLPSPDAATGQTNLQPAQPVVAAPQGSAKPSLTTILPKIQLPKELPPPIEAAPPMSEQPKLSVASLEVLATLQESSAAEGIAPPTKNTEPVVKTELPKPASDTQVIQAKSELTVNVGLPKPELSESEPPKATSGSSINTDVVETSQSNHSVQSPEMTKDSAIPIAELVEKAKPETVNGTPKAQLDQQAVLSNENNESDATKPAKLDPKANEISIIENRLPPALTGEVNQEETIALIVEQEERPTNQSNKEVADDETIAVAVPTVKASDMPATAPNSPSIAIPSKQSSGIKVNADSVKTGSKELSAAAAPISPESLIVDGVLTSPTAQKIQIDLLKSQLAERDSLLNEFSRMQKTIEERMDLIVRSNDQLSQKDSARIKELHQLQRESEKAVQERELQIANLQSELAGARADTKNQLTMLAKQVMEAQQSKTSEVIKLSDQLLAARKARTDDIDSAKVQFTTEQQNELVEAEKVVDEQRKVIQDLQTALKRLGSQLARLDDNAGESKASVLDEEVTQKSESKANLATKDSKSKSKPNSDSEPQTASQSTANPRPESRAKLPTPVNSSPKSESTSKRRSF